MLPVINVFGHELASYMILIFIGMFIGIFIAVKYFSKFNNLKSEDVIYCFLYAVIGLGIGAKLLYIITNIPFFIENYQKLDFSMILQIFRGGFVFYGGLIGAILGIFIYSKQFKISFSSLLLTLIPVVPLIHAFGRIGCFLAGCCYGIEYHGIGSVIFTNTTFAPLNVPLFPVQLLESFCNLIIFAILLCTYKKYINTYKTIALYCILYSITRFFVEFLRGDLIRGFLLNLSTSQWISLITFIIGIYIYFHSSKIKVNK